MEALLIKNKKRERDCGGTTDVIFLSGGTIDVTQRRRLLIVGEKVQVGGGGVSERQMHEHSKFVIAQE